MAATDYFTDVTLALNAQSPIAAPVKTTQTTETEPIATRADSGIFGGVSALFGQIITGAGAAITAAAPVVGAAVAQKLVEPSAAAQQQTLTAKTATQGTTATRYATEKEPGQWLAGVSNGTVILAVVGVAAVAIIGGYLTRNVGSK